MIKKNEEVTVCIESLEFPNKGIGFIGGDKIIVKNAIIGQTVIVNVKKKRNRYEGRLIGVVEKAPYEIDPECAVFGVCGGCTYQNIDYAAELEIKKNAVLKLFEKSNLDGFEFLGIKPSPCIKGYRNKMEFSFGDSEMGGELSLGMRKRNSYYEVADASCCEIVDSDIRAVLGAVVSFFRQNDESFYHRKKRTGYLRHLVVRKAFFTGELLLNLVTSADTISYSLDGLKDLLLGLSLDGKIAGILHTVNTSLADVVKADDINILYGRDYFYEELLGLKFKISAFSFFQTNSDAAEILYSTVKDFIGRCDDKIIFDLYCGTGTIAQLVSENAKKVIGIEIIPEAVLAAEDGATLNNISNCEFIAGDVLSVVDTLSAKPDIIVIDPPRMGIHPKAINKIIAFGASRIVYVSCNPDTLTNDLIVFTENGYGIEKVRCVDMFPRTYHVETICLMSLKIQ